MTLSHKLKLTGLKDNNGREIRLGDRYISDNGKIYEVVFRNGKYMGKEWGKVK